MNDYRVKIKLGKDKLISKPTYIGEAISLRKTLEQNFSKRASVFIETKDNGKWVRA